jgi:hypothetical protein
LLQNSTNTVYWSKEERSRRNRSQVEKAKRGRPNEAAAEPENKGAKADNDRGAEKGAFPGAFPRG